MKNLARAIIATITFLIFCGLGGWLGWLGYKTLRLDEDLVRELLFTKIVELTLNHLLLIGHQLLAFAAIPLCLYAFGAVGAALMHVIAPAANIMPKD